MNCPLQNNEGADLILDFCSNRLDADQAIPFERHIADCAECRQVVEAQRAVWEALDAYDATAVSDDFDEKLWKRIEESESRSWWRKAFDGPVLGWSSLISWKPALVTASACAAVFAVMLVTTPSANTSYPDPSRQATPVVDKAAMTVDVDQIEKTLEDLDMLKQMGVVDENSAGMM